MPLPDRLQKYLPQKGTIQKGPIQKLEYGLQGGYKLLTPHEVQEITIQTLTALGADGTRFLFTPFAPTTRSVSTAPHISHPNVGYFQTQIRKKEPLGENGDVVEVDRELASGIRHRLLGLGYVGHGIEIGYRRSFMNHLIEAGVGNVVNQQTTWPKGGRKLHQAREIARAVIYAVASANEQRKRDTH